VALRVLPAALMLLSPTAFGGQYDLGTLGSADDGLMRGYCTFEKSDKEMVCYTLQLFRKESEARTKRELEMAKLKTSQDAQKELEGLCRQFKSAEITERLTEASEAAKAAYAEFMGRMRPVCEGKFSEEKIDQFISATLDFEDATCKFSFFGNQDYPVRFKQTGKDTWTATDKALCKQNTIVLSRSGGSLWTYERTSVKINHDELCKHLDSKTLITKWSWKGSKTFHGGCKYIEID
jgi:hypothetical protein